ncbi:hypothetical protein [Pseudomonas gingeri]|uniref:hypothetical protein n=1 Tax=Pseudomonas gingeri TaxID=117681 RepID=UPI0015A28B93|nr:hypothetical protein [Pseudomonas gingeri]NWD07084.1 hypothetical protein [Pseudomonas gingeri]NWD51757.1 hypothetical protein [Pseudomonas gingeri]NWE31683.1 hypothetical protein [Pseudomonas gingeri]NWE57300.1 hypothetical protein [Pseudomonas gingeri]NWF00149.1 hypothetical protein [Pseudomonas gingeri]
MTRSGHLGVYVPPEREGCNELRPNRSEAQINFLDREGVIWPLFSKGIVDARHGQAYRPAGLPTPN